MEFAETNESFRTIALHNTNFHNIIENLNINESNIKLTPDQKYITQSMRTKLPFLSVIIIEEKKLFTMLCTTHSMNISAIINTWNNHIHGVTIFPKLEVYLQTYLDK